MDIVSIIGMILAVVGVFVGMILKGVSPSALLNTPALLIIIVGTIGAVCIATPMDKMKNIGKLFGVVFTNKKQITQQEAIEEIVHYAEKTRREGLLSLEAEIENIKDPFIQRALGMLILGCTQEYLEEVLQEDISAMQDRHLANAQIFNQAGTYAPTLGVLGAVIGLIAALGNMSDIGVLGHAISAAFVATLFGIFTGYVLWFPFANKLKEKSKAEALTKYIILKGTVAIFNGENPSLIREKLISYVSPSQRDKLMNRRKEE